MLTNTPLRTLDTYLRSLIEAKLWQKVLLALLLGIIIGSILSPEVQLIPIHVSESVSSWLSFPGNIFMKLIQMIMIPLIFSSIITGLVSSPLQQLKKYGAYILLYFLGTTILSVAIGSILSLLINPGKGFDMSDEFIVLEKQQVLNTKFSFGNIPDAITQLLPGNPLASMVSGELLTIVIFTFIIGFAISNLNQSSKTPLIQFLNAIQEICMTIVKWAMKLVPLAVFGLMVNLVASTGMNSMKGLGMYAFTVFIALALMLFIYMLIVWILGKKNPFSFLNKIKEVQLLAFSTTSSAAVMPLSIKTAQDDLGLDKGISNLIIPLGSTINMDGTAIYQCISMVFITQICGIDLSLSSLVVLSLTIILASIGTPGVPGAGIIVLATTLESIGIPSKALLMIIGLERILGMFRTAVNVTGDLSACVIFDHWFKKPKA